MTPSPNTSKKVKKKTMVIPGDVHVKLGYDMAAHIAVYVWKVVFNQWLNCIFLHCISETN